MWRCPNCDTQYNDNENFCTIDGTPRQAQKNVTAGWKVVPKPQSDNGEYQREKEKRKLREKLQSLTERQKKFRIGVILCVCIVLVLCCVRYATYTRGWDPYKGASYNPYSYTVLFNVLGENGSIEQVCSIVMLLFSAAPIVLVLISLDGTKRSLITVLSIVSAAVVSIYCLSIIVGSTRENIVPYLILLMQWAAAYAAGEYVKCTKELENMLFSSSF